MREQNQAVPSEKRTGSVKQTSSKAQLLQGQRVGSQSVHSMRSVPNSIPDETAHDPEYHDVVSDINNRDIEVSYDPAQSRKPDPILDSGIPSHRNVSVQANETARKQSILKNSTQYQRTTSGMHPDCSSVEALREESPSQKQRHHAREKSDANSYMSNRSNKSRRSFDANQSYATEKSYRAPVESTPPATAMSKIEAATLIQKHFRKYQCQTDYRFMKAHKSQIGREMLFKALVQGENTQLVTCFVHRTWQGHVKTFSYAIGPTGRMTRGNTHNFEIDVASLEIDSDEDLKERVLQVMRHALNEEQDLEGAIRSAFSTERAHRILTSEFLQEDDGQEGEDADKANSECEVGSATKVEATT